MFGDDQEQIPKRTWIITIISIIVILFVIIPRLVERAENNSDYESPRQQASNTRTEASDISKKERSTSERLGSRQNPAQIGDTMTVKVTTVTDDEFRISVTLLDVVRGTKATQRVINDLDLFSTAPDGKEYVIATFQVSVLEDLSGKDKPYSVRGYNFELCNSTYVKTSNLFDSVTLSDYLTGDVYEGGSITGTVVFTADINEDCYAVLSDYLWFTLPSEELIQVFVPNDPEWTLNFNYEDYETYTQYNNGKMYFIDPSVYEKNLIKLHDEVSEEMKFRYGKVEYFDDFSQVSITSDIDSINEYMESKVYEISGKVFLYNILAKKEQNLVISFFDQRTSECLYEYTFDKDYPHLSKLN